MTINYIITASAFLICSFFFNPWLSLAENRVNNEIYNLIAKEKSELQKLKDKIKKHTKTLSKMGNIEYSILKKQRILDDKLKSYERELKIYNWNLKINNNKIKTLTSNISKSKKKLNLQTKLMAKRLRTIYKEGDMFPVKVLFSSVSFVDLLTRLKYMESIALHDGELFNKVREQINEYKDKKNSLLTSKQSILVFKDSARLKKNKIKSERVKKNKFLKRLSEDKSVNKRLKNELVQSSKNLNQLIARLEKKQSLGEGIDFEDKKGRLLPPVSGKYLNKFGRKRDKQYNTFIVYNGVRIQSSKGTPVRSIFEGKILYTGTLEGYGNIVIVGHGKNYHSLYGHLDEIITKKGKAIRLGQIIARSGDTGSTVGESLYFEIRYKGNPIEPTAWLNHSKNSN